jgi:hypothetical protein
MPTRYRRGRPRRFAYSYPLEGGEPSVVKRCGARHGISKESKEKTPGGRDSRNFWRRCADSDKTVESPLSCSALRLGFGERLDLTPNAQSSAHLTLTVELRLLLSSTVFEDQRWTQAESLLRASDDQQRPRGANVSVEPITLGANNLGISDAAMASGTRCRLPESPAQTGWGQ